MKSTNLNKILINKSKKPLVFFLGEQINTAWILKSKAHLALFSGIAYLLHKFSFYLFKISVVLSILKYSIYYFWYVHSDFYSPIKVKEKSFDNGDVFSFRNKYQNGLLLFDIKTFLHIVTYNNTIEKLIFWDVYSFLLIETVLTIRILKKINQ
jgi:hypothetical protein